MKIGFIGAGRAGCSLGKYFAVKGDAAGIELTGYYSLIEEEASWAAEFTQSACMESPDNVLLASDAVILSTPDGAVRDVWNALDKRLAGGKMICHLSGSLSSDVFSGSGDYGAEPVSIHPMFAFSNRESVYEQLHHASFTLEGNGHAVSVWKDIFTKLGNPAIQIDASVKAKYHAAASLLSNHVAAVLAAGYELLEECGFSGEEARAFSRALVENNVEHVICDGVEEALTGPVERADTGTVEKHLSVLSGEQRALYKVCADRLLAVARRKNPDRDYDGLHKLLKEVS